MKKLILSLIIMISLVLSGCGTVNIHHKIDRNGDYDINFIVLTDSELLIENTIKFLAENEDFNEENIQVLEDGILYQIKSGNMIEFSQEEEDFALISKFEMEKGFPFNYYTMRFDNSITEDKSEINLEEAGVEANYIVELFGKIHETNGEIVDNTTNVVKFNLQEKTDYYVTIREPFFKSLFSGHPELPFEE